MSLVDRQVLYISYNGMLDPLGQSQVIPYLKELSKLGVRFTLLSFERAPMNQPELARKIKAVRDSLAADGIDWRCLRYHQKPSLPATAYDVWAGVRYASSVMRTKQIEIVHARSHIPAEMADRLKRRFGVKMIFDLRGLLADEYVDAGHWRKGSLAYRITKASERRSFMAADGIVTLTETIWPIINQWDGLRGRELSHEVVPCCVDLDLFRFNAEERQRRRREMKTEDAYVVVYSGSIDGWYLTEAMADFFVKLSQQKPNAHFLWLTPTRHDRIRSLMHERGVDTSKYSVVAAESREVPSYLSASDVGLAFIKPCFSKLASSPTKFAEYLACGLPLIINAGIGDSDALVNEEHAGVLVRDIDEASYLHAAGMIEQAGRMNEETRRRNREIAARLFDVRRVGVERYARLYERVLEIIRE